MSERTVVFFNKLSKKTLDVREGHTNDGAVIQQYYYHGGGNQRFRVIDEGTQPLSPHNIPNAESPFPNEHSIVAYHSNNKAIMVDPDPSNTGTIVQYELANKSRRFDQGQLWQLVRLTPADRRDLPLYVVRNTKHDQVLQLKNTNASDGTELELSPYNGSDEQQWHILYEYLLSASSMTAVIFNRHSHKCLDIPGFSTANDTIIQQYTFNGGRNQQWDIEDKIITSVHSAKALDINDTRNLSLEDGRKIVQRSSGGGPIYLPSMKWNIRTIPFINTPKYYIDNELNTVRGTPGQKYPTPPSGLVLDVRNGSLDDSEQVQVYEVHFGDNQLWDIWVKDP